MGKVDLHSHLIPGVDDGVKTLEESLAVIEGLIQRGYDRALTTPHQVDRWRPDEETLTAKLRELQDEIRRRNWPFRLGLGAENYLDDVFVRRLRENRLVSYGMAGKAVLLECSPMSAPPFLEQLVFELKAGGTLPVLAHPERYPWLFGSRDRITPLRQAGCYFQVDLGSFAGAYGRDAMKAAKKLVKLDAVSFVSSDLHGPSKLGLLLDDGLRALRDCAPAEKVSGWTESVPAMIFEEASSGNWGAPKKLESLQ
jgi:tyrosine-protein phosphatase YwqE